MQIKTAGKYHYSPVRRQNSKRKKPIVSNVDKEAEHLECSYTAGRKANGTPTMENNSEVSYKVKYIQQAIQQPHPTGLPK